MKKIYLFFYVCIAFFAITSCSDSNNEPVLSSLNSITSFKINFEGLYDKDITYNLGNDINISVPYKTSLSSLIPTIAISENATILPASGTAINFIDGKPVPFTVTAQDGTKKVYNVTITIRGEVGSGSRLKTYRRNDAWGTDATITYTYSNANFVTEISTATGSETTVFNLIYDAKNQVIEYKSEDGKDSTIYTYNDKGQIESSEQTLDGTLTYATTYTYSDNGELISRKRINKTDNKEDEITYEYTNGNVTKEVRFNQPFEATYDDKNNPFKGIYPVAYAAINSGIESVTQNNPVTMTGADGEITYTYNTDNYPLTSSYTYFDGLATIEKTFTYYTK